MTIIETSFENRYNLQMDIDETLMIDMPLELHGLFEDVGPGHIRYDMDMSVTYTETFDVCLDMEFNLTMKAEADGRVFEIDMPLAIEFGDATNFNAPNDDCIPDYSGSDGFYLDRQDDEGDLALDMSMDVGYTSIESFDIGMSLDLSFNDLSTGGTPEAGTGLPSSGLFAVMGSGNFTPSNCPSLVFYGDAGFVNSNDVPRQSFELFENTNWTGTTVTLKPPVIGDRVDLQPEQVQREDVHRTFISHSESDWDAARTVRYAFENLTEATKDAFLSFLTLTQGKPIGIIDHNTRAWNAIILSIEDPVITQTEKSDCKYRISLTLLWTP